MQEKQINPDQQDETPDPPYALVQDTYSSVRYAHVAKGFIHNSDFSAYMLQSQLDSQTHDAYKPHTPRPNGQANGLAE
nr:hypothetical protein [uncultured Cohaesibacter sp.]